MKEFEELLELENDGDITQTIIRKQHLLKYRAGKAEDIFRKWLEQNLWVFGVEYFKKHGWRIVAEDAIADLVMETADGFIDLIELKRPKLPFPLFNKHSSHNGYYPSAQFSQAVGQCLFYLKRLDEKKNNIEQKQDTKILCPRVKLVIGRSRNFTTDEFETMRILNANFGSITVITYDDLLRNGKQIIDYYEKSKR
ncbi:MAG: Shedu anti-phage system protein SduA domain-containing protein [Patescibacteria group bacterium]